jgi:hypothetical protein
MDKTIKTITQQIIDCEVDYVGADKLEYHDEGEWNNTLSAFDA